MTTVEPRVTETRTFAIVAARLNSDRFDVSHWDRQPQLAGAACGFVQSAS
jgi:hypothetical protein